MVQMIFATYLVAADTRALNGCVPRWVHLLSEADAPARSCSDFHRKLSWHQGVSHFTYFRNRGPFDCSDPSLCPIAKTFEW
mgnify:CR=1 FL=1|jgi:hypothetical protein